MYFPRSLQRRFDNRTAFVIGMHLQSNDYNSIVIDNNYAAVIVRTINTPTYLRDRTDIYLQIPNERRFLVVNKHFSTESESRTSFIVELYYHPSRVLLARVQQ